MSLNSYSPHTWEDGEKIIADNLNHIETGINDLSSDYLGFKNNLQEQVTSMITEAASDISETLDSGTLKKSGTESARTMEGDLFITKSAPGLYFKKTSIGDIVGGIYHTTDNNSQNRLVLLQRVDGSAHAEGFFLPVPNINEQFASYQLLTTKDLVSIAQGGTGANTADLACTNLGAIKKSGDVVTGILKISDTELHFKSSLEENSRVKIYRKNDSQLVFAEYGDNATEPEIYYIPKPVADNTTIKHYEFLTTRNPVTIAQGGTGVTTTDDLRKLIGTTSYILSSNSTVTLGFNGFGTGLLICNGSSDSLRSMFYIYNNNTYSSVRFQNILSNSTIGVDTGTNIALSSSTSQKLKIKNNSTTAGMYINYIRITGAVPSFS